jgi:hypothetical protein
MAGMFFCWMIVMGRAQTLKNRFATSIASHLQTQPGSKTGSVHEAIQHLIPCNEQHAKSTATSAHENTQHSMFSARRNAFTVIKQDTCNRTLMISQNQLLSVYLSVCLSVYLSAISTTLSNVQ